MVTSTPSKNRQRRSDGRGAQPTKRRSGRCAASRPAVSQHAINGAALGGGYGPSAIIASSSTIGELWWVAEPARADPAAGGTRTPRLIGVKARSACSWRASFAPDKALKRAVDQVVEAGELLEAATKWLEESPCATQPWDQRGFSVPGGDMDGAAKNTLMVATALYNAKTFGNYPAGQAVLSCVAEGLRLPIDAALRIEKTYFVKMLLGDVARAMVPPSFWTSKPPRRAPGGRRRSAPRWTASASSAPASWAAALRSRPREPD